MNYLDTSVLTAYYCPEARTPRVQELLSRVEGPTISPLVEVELCCAVARKARAGSIEESSALLIFSRLQADLAESKYRVVPIRSVEYDLAREWLTQLASPLRVLDALHMAAALSNDLTLRTADKALAEAADHFGVKHRLLP
jgi:predicted nucleic acid-binding protein